MSEPGLWVVGDIHGHYDTLVALLNRLDGRVCFVGDLIDRGPKSKQVVDLVMSDPARFDCVRGNHEDLMASEDPHKIDFAGAWIYNGGVETLASYGNYHDKTEWSHAVHTFAKHQAWMRSLPVFKEYPELEDAQGRHLLVSHSSAARAWNSAVAKADSKLFEEDLMWYRGPTADIPGIYNVFGHTPKPKPIVEPYYANVDTGCYYVHGVVGYRKLTAIHFPSFRVYQQDPVDYD